MINFIEHFFKIIIRYLYNIVDYCLFPDVPLFSTTFHQTRPTKKQFFLVQRSKSFQGYAPIIHSFPLRLTQSLRLTMTIYELDRLRTLTN